MTPEDRGRSPTMQERMTRWPRVDNLDRARLNKAWEMVERERRTVTEARDALLIKAGRGANAMSRMAKRVEEVMIGMKESYCTGCRGGGGFQDREQFGSMTARAPSAESEHGHPASQGSPAMREKKKTVEVRSRDGSKVLEPEE